jgi:hypothetical protein
LLYLVDEGESGAEDGPFSEVTGRLGIPFPEGEEESVDMTEVDIFNSSRGFEDSGVVAGVSMTVAEGVVVDVVELVGPNDGDDGAA